jgi:hypothetical protein
MLKEGNRPEEALTSSEQELRLLVEAIPALVWRLGAGRHEDARGEPLDRLLRAAHGGGRFLRLVLN